MFALEEAMTHMGDAEDLLASRTFDVSSEEVLSLALGSGCSAYDCEFVWLAQDLGVPLITSDKAILTKFKSIAVSMRAFCD
jgi:predicted nucleic acid-binding protein